MKCLVSCVTKEPKFRPTMQCQVGPFLSSNYGCVRCCISGGVWDREGGWAYSLFDVLCDVLPGMLVGGD